MIYKITPDTKFIPQHGIAAYPKEYIKATITEHKICIQFLPVVVKARLEPENFTNTVKQLGRSSAIPVDTQGAEIKCLSVGIPLQMHKSLLLDLIDAYKAHSDQFGSEMLDFLSELRTKIDKTLNGNKDTSSI